MTVVETEEGLVRDYTDVWDTWVDPYADPAVGDVYEDERWWEQDRV